jgi:hypothetical protein
VLFCIEPSQRIEYTPGMKTWLQNLSSKLRGKTRFIDEASSTDTSPERLAELAEHSNALALVVAVAKNPSARPAILTLLATHSDEGVASAVAQNPNTPIESLLYLAPKHPQAFQDNPLLPLLLLEDPGLFKRFSVGVVLSLLKAPYPYPALLEYAANLTDSACRKVAAMKLKDPALLKHLLSDSDKEIATAAMQNAALPEALFQRFEDVRNETSKASDAELLSLARLGLWPRVLIVSAKKTPLSVVELLLEHSHPEVCLAALSRPKLPFSMIEGLLQQYLPPAANPPQKYRVLTAIAKQANCSAGQLSWLLKDIAFNPIEEALASHPALCVDDILTLARSSNAKSRLLLAARRDLPPQVQERLSEDPEDEVRTILQVNYPRPMDECARWRQLLEQGRLSESQALLFSKRGDNAAFDLLKHPKTPPIVQQQIANQAGPLLIRKISNTRLSIADADLIISTKNIVVCLAIVNSRIFLDEVLLLIAPLQRLIQERLFVMHRGRLPVLVALLAHDFLPAAESLLCQSEATREQLLLVVRKIKNPWKHLSVRLCKAANLPEEALPILLPRYWEHLSKHPKLGEWCKKPALVALFPGAMKRQLQKNPALAALLYAVPNDTSL